MTNNPILLLFLLVSSICYTQYSVSGLVVDENNIPIEFANVLIKNVKTGDETLGATTDANGAFFITLKENSYQNEYKITISFIGFETWTKTKRIDASIDLNSIVLKEKSSELEGVTLTANAPTISKKEDKIIFNVQNSPLKTGYDGIELLKNTPTVWIDNGGSILIRNEAVRVLINGRKVNMSGDNLTAYLTNLNSDAIKSIEIQTAKGANVEATSTGGIINIILKEKVLGFKAQLNLGYVIKRDNYSSLYPNVSASYGSEKWNIYGSYYLSVRNDFQAITNDVYFNDLNRQNHSERQLDNNSTRNNFKLGFVRDINEKHDLGIEVFGTTNTKDFTDNGNAFYYVENKLNDQGVNNTFGTSGNNSVNGVLNHSWKIASNEKLNTFIDYATNTTNNNSEVTTTYEAATFEDNVNTFKSDTKTTIYAIQTDYSKTFAKDAKLDVGFKYTNSDRDNSLVPKYLSDSNFVLDTAQLSDFNYQENVFATYASFGKTFKEKNYYKIGLRMEKTSLNKTNNIDASSIKQNYTSFFPSLYFSRKVTSQKTLSVSYNRSFSRPSFRDLNNNISKVNDFQYYLGNPDLQPEFINKYELSYQFKKNSIALFYTKTNDAINGIYYVEDDVAYYKKFNAGAQLQYGVDYSISTKINVWWYLNFSTYVYNRKFIDEQNIAMFQKATLGAKVYNNFEINKTTSIDLSVRYRSPKSDAFFEADEFYAMDIGFKKTLFKKKISLRVDVKDIFNVLEYSNIREFSKYSTFANTKPITRYLYIRLAYNFTNNRKILGKKNKSKNDNYDRM